MIRPKTIDDLEPRFRRLIGLLCKGWCTKEIALEMHLKERTVTNYLRVIYDELCMERRSMHALVALAMEERTKK